MTEHSNNNNNSNNHGSGVCFICANHNPKFWAISDCQHVVCAECILRLRVLYESMACPMCKMSNQTVLICTSSQMKTLTNQRFAKDPNLLIEFYDKSAKDFAIQTLTIACPICKQVLDSKDEIKKHIREKHKAFICDICLKNRKVFTFEIKTFSNAHHLEKHQKSGDETATKGHPQCPCCHLIFYSGDELDQHLRLKHEQCHICSRKSTLEEEQEQKGPSSLPLSEPGSKQRQQQQREPHKYEKKLFYFRDYVSLEEHFDKSHFLCRDPLCRELKFVVFESEIEFKKHTMEVHLPKIKMQRSKQNELLRVNVQFRQGRGEEGSHEEDANNVDERGERTGFSRSSNSRSHFPHDNSNIQNPRNGAIMEKVTIKDYLFGDTMDHLSDNLQSIKLLEEKNESMKQILNNFKIDFNKVRAMCVLYHQEKIAPIDLVTRLKSILGGDERMKHLWKGIVLLEPIKDKQRILQMSFESYFRRLDAFPILPSTSIDMLPSSQSTSSFLSSKSKGNNNGHYQSAMTQGKKGETITAKIPINVLRLTNSSTVIPVNVMKKSDPSSNPLLVLSSSKGGEKKKLPSTTITTTIKRIPPSFNQILSPSGPSLVGINREAIDSSFNSINSNNNSLSSPTMPLLGDDSPFSYPTTLRSNTNVFRTISDGNGSIDSTTINNDSGSKGKSNKKTIANNSIGPDIFKPGEGLDNKLNDDANGKKNEKSTKSKSDYRSGKLVFKSGQGFQS